MQGRIIRQISGYYDIAVDGEVVRTRAAGNLRQQKVTPLVGDIAEFIPAEDNGELGYLTSIKERQNALLRPPVANIDQAILVTSAAEPEFSANLLDRFLVYLEGKNIAPIIYLTKTDLLTDEEYARLDTVLQGYAQIPYRVFAPREAFAEDVLATLHGLFADKLTIFTGQTGAGKSTLINHLAPGLNIATGAISKSLNRGKHTTRTTDLYQSDGGLLADTPGFSSLGLLDVTLDDLRLRFPEFRARMDGCKFRRCEHISEPKCAVKAALDAGEIMQSRYDDYLQFRSELKQQRPVWGKN
ncbi:ribosome small subunit-dependent GTPase A [Lacticaseibacillus zhaodongensis]|uniref:ribosome small subunit-dependent GTPase A n=1 Tax=Lacticaseibacillus zhaodongensis TaxID=2668065 RepID=UPI0012D2A3FB|nr:ribosome small subunit-dependent GTPase A [Lacticaseibacillus zhaodongensis]